MTTPTETNPARRNALIVLGIVAGVLILGLIALLASYSFGSTTTSQADPVTAEAVVVDLRAPGDFEVIATDEGQISVETRVRDPFGRVSNEQRVDGDTLTLESRCSTFWIDFFNPCRVDYVVRVPASTDVSGSTHNTRIEVTGLEAPVDLSNGNGSMTVEDVEGLVRLETSNGAIQVSGTSGNLILETDNGGVTIRDSTAPGVVEVVTSNGSIEVSGTTAEEMRLLTSNGGIDLTEVAAPQISAETGNSSVTMGLSTSPEGLVAETSNGDIEIVLPADAPPYAVEATTSNGDTDTGDLVVDPSAAFTIDANTGNGSIKISRDAS